jgi:hypothetical protein
MIGEIFKKSHETKIINFCKALFRCECDCDRNHCQNPINYIFEVLAKENRSIYNTKYISCKDCYEHFYIYKINSLDSINRHNYDFHICIDLSTL